MGKHVNRRRRTAAGERLYDHMVVDDETECWIWTGATNASGYGRIGVWRDDGRCTNAATHRVSYEYDIGPIPDGLQIDHLCRNRLCFNPKHLEPVTPSENARRAKSAITHCPSGHPYSGDNLIQRKGRRLCRECRNIYNRAYIARKKAERG